MARPRKTQPAINDGFIGCQLKELPDSLLLSAAAKAVECNPMNAPCRLGALAMLGGADLQPSHLAIMTTKYWQQGVKLTVAFLEPTPPELQARILAQANRWGQWANISFVASNIDPQVRVTREGQGYWSYLGTDILSIPKNQPTMCLQAFSMSTPESEFRRVVPHEFAHTWGAVHEHQRKQEVARLDRAKTIAYFQQTQGWPASVTQQQVLTPLNEASIRGTPNADDTSIMCYSLPGSITIDGKPIVGGSDINALDAAFVASIYPKPDSPPPPPPPPATGGKITIDLDAKTIKAPADWANIA